MSAVDHRLGNEQAATHGMTPGTQVMERRVAPVAVNHRRAVLRQLKMSPKDLDPIGRGYLDQYCRVTSKVALIDKWIEQHGMIGADGEPAAALRLYASLVNSARMALAKLEQHLLVDAPVDPSSKLQQYIDAQSELIPEDEQPPVTLVVANLDDDGSVSA